MSVEGSGELMKFYFTTTRKKQRGSVSATETVVELSGGVAVMESTVLVQVFKSVERSIW